jgi:hypothetical protein
MADIEITQIEARINSSGKTWVDDVERLLSGHGGLLAIPLDVSRAQIKLRNAAYQNRAR